jgi:hypothetical protein
MTTLPFKVNGKGRGHPNDRELAGYLKWLSDDLWTVEAQRRDCLRQFGKRRAEVYALARECGLAPRVLRAAYVMRRKELRA